MTIREKLIAGTIDAAGQAGRRASRSRTNSIRGENGKGSRETAIASEPSLACDWLRSEEDETWKDFVRYDGVALCVQRTSKLPALCHEHLMDGYVLQLIRFANMGNLGAIRFVRFLGDDCTLF